MNDRLKLFLWFQLLPFTLLLAISVGVVISVTFSYQAYGDPTAPFMTDWERNPDIVTGQIWQGVEFVLFFFLAGLPFEAWLLHLDKVDRRAAATAAAQKRHTHK